MVKKRGLGKSLDALLAYTADGAVDAFDKNQEKLEHLPIDCLERGKYQPRRDMDPEALQELANSIRAQGIIQPLVVRAKGDKYEIIAGERRFRAAQMVGLTESAIVRVIPDETAIAIALIENIQRENLNPIEEALALERLIEEFGMTHQQVAEAVSKSRVTVTNLLRLLALTEEVKQLLGSRQIEMGHARALLTLPEHQQIEVAQVTANKRLSVRETENWVRKLQSPLSDNLEKPQNADAKRLQDNLSRLLKLPVALYYNAKGKGKLVIHYRNLAELDALLTQLESA